MYLHPFIHTSIIQLKNLSLSTELISFPAESGIPGHTYKTHAHIKKVNSSFCLSQQTEIIKINQDFFSSMKSFFFIKIFLNIIS